MRAMLIMVGFKVMNIMFQSRHDIEYLLREARRKICQTDINQSLIMLVGELAREVKRMQNEIHKIRSNARRRFL